MSFELTNEQNYQQIINYLVKTNGMIDGEILASLLGLTHRQLNIAISNHRKLLEAALENGETSLYTRNTARSRKDGKGGVLETHYMLNRTQVLMLAGIMRTKGDKDLLIAQLSKAFLQAIDIIANRETVQIPQNAVETILDIALKSSKEIVSYSEVVQVRKSELQTILEENERLRNTVLYADLSLADLAREGSGLKNEE
jgi:hypothetical protein